MPQVPDRTGGFACRPVGRVQDSGNSLENFNAPTCTAAPCSPWGTRMTERDSDFRIRPGKPRDTRAPRTKGFVDQVLRAAQKAGHVSRAPSTGPRSASNFGRGHNRFGRARLFTPTRRVIVAARIARHRGQAFRAAPLRTHLAYLAREGVSRDGTDGRFFDAETDQADGAGFAARCADDRHHFRFIISPEDAAQMEDLRGFTRDLVSRMEADLGTRLDWVAVDHWNTDNPHVHLIVRGVDEGGRDLVIARDYISSGLRSRAEDLVALELGPKPEHEIRHALEREVTAERWTRLDRELRHHADDLGLIDLRPDRPGPEDPQIRRLMIGRLQHLRRLGLAAEARTGEWLLDDAAERTLRDLGERGDIIKTMHRALAARGQDRGFSDLRIDRGGPGDPIIGRLVATGLHDEQTGTAYAVIDGTDGRAHHVRFRGLEAFDQAPPPGGIVEVRRIGGAEEARPTLVLANRSDLDLQGQITAPGATWLDHRLVERSPHAARHGRLRGGGARGARGPGRASGARGAGRAAGAADHPAAQPADHPAPARDRRHRRAPLGRDRAAAPAHGGGRTCHRHLPPPAAPVLGPLRDDRGHRAGRRPQLPARPLVPRDRAAPGPARQRHGPRGRRDRLEPRAEAGAGVVIFG
jgi:type IV secretory pathway VirD2 relaxase